MVLIKKTTAKVRLLYFWVGMSADTRSWIRRCDICAKRKSSPQKRRAQLQQVPVGAPIEWIAVDVVGQLPKIKDGNAYILLVGDYFS